MKKNLLLCCLLVAFMPFNGCKKDSDKSGAKTFKEDFVDVFSLSSKGWFFKDNSSPESASWTQGFTGGDKSGRAGFDAYSYKVDKDEYAYIGYPSWSMSSINISSWMITPIYQIKNGDKLTFYTRTASTGYADRLQVRLNESDNTPDVGNSATSVGSFTILLKDINEASSLDGYPQNWTKYEITISGLSGPKQSRIGFRYFVDGSKSNAIGIDAFSFTSL
jgi:hypothetical protein